jgi:hypothetical protein
MALSAANFKSSTQGRCEALQPGGDLADPLRAAGQLAVEADALEPEVQAEKVGDADAPVHLGGRARHEAAHFLGAQVFDRLAPDDLAAQGRADPAALLLLRPHLRQGRDQHGDTLPRHAARRAGGDERLGNDPALEDIGLGAEAAVFARDGAHRIAVLDRQPLPGQHVLRRALRVVAAMRLEEPSNLAAERRHLGRLVQVHGVCSLFVR